MDDPTRVTAEQQPPPDSDGANANNPPPTVALVQRSVPHYRVPLFEKLQQSTRFRWRFFADAHAGGESSGLASPDLARLDLQPIRNRRLAGPLVWQSGVPVRRGDCDVLMVDLGWTIVSNPVRLRRARANGVATVGWSKGMAQDLLARKPAWRRAAERWIASQCDTLVAYGRTSRDYFAALGFPAERIFIAQNCTDTARIVRDRAAAVEQASRLRARLGLGDHPVVGFLGKMAAFKRVDAIVQAWELARRSGMDAALVLAGTGPDRHAIEAQIARSEFAVDIRHQADVPAGDEGGWFQLFDLYASFAQGGLGLLEAMAHRRAILSTPEKFPETELLEDNQTAFLSRDFTIESFARRMSEAIAAPAQRNTIAAAAEARVLAGATQEKMVEAIEVAAVRALALRRAGRA
jgi:glycosyltransferase involved in cell wall biosynthesis